MVIMNSMTRRNVAEFFILSASLNRQLKMFLGIGHLMGGRKLYFDQHCKIHETDTIVNVNEKIYGYLKSV